jgi:hypothetical protein
MSNEEIHKLLGGYATNTLTEAERKALFDASLDDQELFNALQDEQALKDLLADPVSRAQVQRALEEPIRAKPQPAWWTRWWAWSGAVSAVAAAVLIVGVIQNNRPKPAAALQQAASVARDGEVKSAAVEEPKPAARAASNVADSLKKRAKEIPASGRGELAGRGRKDEVASAHPPAVKTVEPTTTAPSPAPATAPGSKPAPAPPPAPAQVANTREQLQVQSAIGGPSQNAAQNQNAQNESAAQNRAALADAQNRTASAQNSFRDGARQFGGLGGQAMLRYSLLKQDASGAFLPLPQGAELKTGDAVRLYVLPIVSGYLSLDHQESSGAQRRVFPATGEGITVVANTSYTIPDAAIRVTDRDEKLRLTLVPSSFPESKSDSTQRSVKAKAAPAEAGRRSEPLFVDLTIGPKRAP